ncbi:MAG: hypothetical protein KKD33_03455, partial [Verrucomicrobia bacterium]|nr:hypothetical protein [Verrucomicrobiota bacterium]
MRAWVLLILGLGPALTGLCADDDQTKEVWIESTKAAPSARAKWSVEAEHYCSQAQVVNDPDARNGRALYAQQGVAREWYMTTATYSYQELYGRYRFTFRVKTSDNTTTNPVIAIGIRMQDGVAKENVERVLRGTDFRQANQYEDFTVEMLRGDSGYPAYLMWYRGGADVWVDCITIERTGDVTDKDLAEL